VEGWGLTLGLHGIRRINRSKNLMSLNAIKKMHEVGILEDNRNDLLPRAAPQFHVLKNMKIL
jgi:hypothetical protein